jgi:hypothetical protein
MAGLHKKKHFFITLHRKLIILNGLADHRIGQMFAAQNHGPTPRRDRIVGP